MAESTRKSSRKKISIVLPGQDRSEASPLSSLVRQKDDYNDDIFSSSLSGHDVSVTSYIVQHSRRKNRGNFIPQMYNESAAFVNFNTTEKAWGPPTGWLHQSGNRTMTPKINTAKEDVKLKSDYQINEEEEKEDSSASPPMSITPPSSCSASSFKQNTMVTSNKPPFPVISYQRPQVAVQNKIIDFSDVPLLRLQISALRMTHNNKKYRKDFARTSHDIHRLKLNRPETTRRQFRDVCVTYLATSPGAANAITGQLG